MAINYTTVLKLPKPDANTQTWATYMHRLADILDGGVVTVTKASGATTFADLSGTADNGKKPIVRTTQTLTGAVTVGVPAKHRLFLAENFSGGTGTWKIATASNSNGVIVPKNKRMLLRSTTTGVLPASRTDGRSTATEIGLTVITASHIASAAIIAAKLATSAVTPAKLAGAGSYGRLLVSATSAGFPFTTLARGTPNQVLAMSTAAVPKPTWTTPAFRKVATSTGISWSNNSSVTFTHGITGISNKYDYRMVIIALECISTDGNYSVGDVLYLGSTSAYDFAGITIVADSVTQIKVLTRSIAVRNKTSGSTNTTLTPGDWVMRVIVFA